MDSKPIDTKKRTAEVAGWCANRKTYSNRIRFKVDTALNQNVAELTNPTASWKEATNLSYQQLGHCLALAHREEGEETEEMRRAAGESPEEMRVKADEMQVDEGKSDGKWKSAGRRDGSVPREEADGNDDAQEASRLQGKVGRVRRSLTGVTEVSRMKRKEYCL